MSHRSKLYGMYEEEGEFDAIMGMSKADEMLEHLGYIKQYENEQEICYLSDIILMGKHFKDVTIFHKISKLVEFRKAYADNGENNSIGFAHSSEINAVWYKMKELGWL